MFVCLTRKCSINENIIETKAITEVKFHLLWCKAQTQLIILKKMNRLGSIFKKEHKSLFNIMKFFPSY